MSLKIIIGFLSLLAVAYGSLDELIIETPFGKLKGVEHDHFISFEGIPYAEKPVGELRFEPPVPFHTKWEGIHEAFHPGKACMQWNHFAIDTDDKLEGSEDCLYLNIYVSKDTLPTAKLPVIFHIHGGALMFGKGDFYGPEYLTQRPMILVTFNYRLGPLGFLSSGCHLIPGNMGMKDQNAALKWIHEHIHLFGGDADKITLTGFSAGGASVHLHHMSEMSKGLFHNGISHSGNALDTWVMQRKPVEKFLKLANFVGCDGTESHDDIVKCLKTKPAEDIVRVVKEYQHLLYNPFQVYGVVVEPKHEKHEEHSHHHKRSSDHHHHHHHSTPFLTEHPRDAIKNNHLHGTTWILGETEDEGLYPVAEFLRKPEYFAYINEHWNTFIPEFLHFADTIPKEKWEEVSQKIKDHYLDGKPLTEENFKRFVDIATDRLFHMGAYEVSILQGKHMPMYAYFYTYKLLKGIGEYLAGKQSNLLGIAHGDDTLLLYYVKETDHALTDNEKALQSKLLDMYVSFANTGIPKFGDFEMVKTDSEDTVHYTRINSPDDIKVASYDNVGDHKFWNTIEFDE